MKFRHLAVAGLVAGGVLLSAPVAYGKQVPDTTTVGACLPGWYVNPDETSRKPTTTVDGLKFEGNDLVHHAAGNFPVANLTPGTYVATPAPSQPSFFSVEVRNPSGAYGTLRWNPATAKWSITIGAGDGPDGAATAGTFEHANPAALLVGRVTKWGKFEVGTNVVASFGVGYTNSPGDGVATVVKSVTFKGTKYDLACKVSPSTSASASASASPSVSASVAPSGGLSVTPSQVSAGLPVTGAPVKAAVVAGVIVVALGVGALLVGKRRRTKFVA